MLNLGVLEEPLHHLEGSHLLGNRRSLVHECLKLVGGQRLQELDVVLLSVVNHRALDEALVDHETLVDDVKLLVNIAVPIQLVPVNINLLPSQLFVLLQVGSNLLEVLAFVTEEQLLAIIEVFLLHLSVVLKLSFQRLVLLHEGRVMELLGLLLLVQEADERSHVLPMTVEQSRYQTVH